MAEKYVTINERSSIFHDQTTGITILKGQVVKLNDFQLNSRRIRNALASGHLVYAPDENIPKEVNKEEKAKALQDKFISMYKGGSSKSKFVQNFSLEDLKTISELYDIVPDKDDTKDILVEAILKEMPEDIKKKSK